MDKGTCENCAGFYKLGRSDERIAIMDRVMEVAKRKFNPRWILSLRVMYISDVFRAIENKKEN